MERIRLKIVMAVLVGSFWTGEAFSHEDIYYIDAHSQYDQYVTAEVDVIPAMERNNVRAVILANRGNVPWDRPLTDAANYPGRIIPAIRSKGGAYNENRWDDYVNFISRQSNARDSHGNRQFQASAEVLIYHAAKSATIPEVIVPLNDPRPLKVFDICREEGWPYIIHIEFAGLADNERREYMKNLEAFISSYPDMNFVLIHMGQLTVGGVMQLIVRHDNIYFATSHSDPTTTDFSDIPWTELFKNEQLAPEWKKVFMLFPDRFVFSLDRVFYTHWDKYDQSMNYWRDAINSLPYDVAHKLAHGNAEKLWNIEPPLAY